VSYLELGCGLGFGATLLAASNPRWQVTAIDFNPAHIAAARRTAAACGLENIRFLEADLATLAEDPAGREVPMADFVSMHGVWSWVPAAVRAGIARLLAARVNPGGVVHLSYNTLPGWSGALGMQRLLREAGKQLAYRSDRQAEEGVTLVKALFDAGAKQLQQHPMVRELLERFGAMPSAYLAHEYMNENWQPQYHAEVAQALAPAKLEFVATADLLDNFTGLTLTEEQRAIARRFDDPLLRELIVDVCTSRTLRHDVFVRGARRISPELRDERLRAVWLGGDLLVEDMAYEVETPGGKAELSPAFYRPIVTALQTAPRRVADLLSLPEFGGARGNPAELVGMLVGLGVAVPMLRPDAPPHRAAQRFNRYFAPAPGQAGPEHPGLTLAAASYAAGCGLRAGRLDLFVLERLLTGDTDADMPKWIAALGPVDAEGEAKLRTALKASLSGQIRLLRAAGAG
jgi:SAM-dependent methyltransferase